MKRVIAILASASFVLVIGCSDYDIRMGKTLEEMRYQKNLDIYLEVASPKGNLKDNNIYIRPPKGHAPSDAFVLTGVEPGKFDTEKSFIDTKNGTSLHVVARIKKAKAPPSGKKAAAAVETVARGKFLDDVVDMVKGAYSVELAPAEFKVKAEGHLSRMNDYKHKSLDLTTKQVEVYVYTESNGVHDVAMIFEFPKEKEKTANMSTKIRYCLESFAVSGRADSLYAGTAELDGTEAIGSGAPPPI